jgi:hypothetical protein
MTGPVVVVLRHAGVLSIGCTITHDDGTVEHPMMNALSMRSAQRTMTSRLRADGYEPVARWVTGDKTSTRTFREGTTT